MGLFPIQYAGSTSYYRRWLMDDQPVVEQCEHFVKQTGRNRMVILGPNGPQKLVIPTIKTGQRRKICDVQISYTERWQKDHWKSLEAAYRASPYFEFYEDQLRPFYTEQWPRLIDLNLAMHKCLLQLLSHDTKIELSKEYQQNVLNDLREKAFATPMVEVETSTYMQVFSDRHPFTANLSVLDLLFNLGPRSRDHLLG